MQESEVLEAINERYFAAKIGGRTRFFEDRFPLEGMDKTSFQFELETYQIQVGSGTSVRIMPAFRVWSAWPGRRYYRDGFFLDSAISGHTERAYNLWRGYSVEPVEGDIGPFKEHLDLIEDAAQDYVWKWICWVVQNPAGKPKVALVLRGDEGVGKGFFGQVLLKLFGPHALHLTHARHVTGNFNSHLRHCCLLFADEADFTGRDGEGVLKTLITEDTMAVEAKGVDVKQEESHVAVFMSTNRAWAVPASLGARRFVVADVADLHKGNAAYFGQLFGWLEAHSAALLHAALNEDLRGWHPEKDRVVTSALRDQQANSLRGVERLLFGLLWEGAACSVIPSRWLADRAQAMGEDKEPGMTIYHRLKDTSWEKENARPVGWRPPRSLATARQELFPNVEWPDDRDEWTLLDKETFADRDWPF